MLVCGMLSRASERGLRARDWGTTLALCLMVWQMLLSIGAIERIMPPVQFANGTLVICTLEGVETLPADASRPALPASHHAGAPCPCCMPFSAGAGFVLADAPGILVPDWVVEPAAPIPATAPRPDRPAVDPQQPRAPPFSI